MLGEADKAFKKLNEIVGRQIKSSRENTEEMQLLKSIRQKVDFVKANPFYGDPIAKKLIPQEYKVAYSAINLFRVFQNHRIGNRPDQEHIKSDTVSYLFFNSDKPSFFIIPF